MKYPHRKFRYYYIKNKNGLYWDTVSRGYLLYALYRAECLDGLKGYFSIETVYGSKNYQYQKLKP